MSNTEALRRIASQFQIDGEIAGITPFGNGHINDTYCVSLAPKGRSPRYVVQRINQNVFKNPAALMENIQRVTAHLAAKAAASPGASQRVLQLIPARNGQAWLVDDGSHWRAYRLIEGASTYDSVQSTGQAFQAAVAFGRFQQQLADLPAPRLHEIIPDFHSTPKRFLALQQAIEADVANRAAPAKPEIEFALARQSITGALLDAGLPERVTHNDTKFNNVLLDDITGAAVCVLDLDTVMPGLAAYDFGDMVRTTTSPAEEDERDLSKVSMQFPMFEALVRGYLQATAGFLTRAETQVLAFSGKLITFEIGIRFLADFLNGDTYFKVHREGQNLDRCRTQFKLVESIEQQEEQMNRLVESIS
jgi:Ser/Thr protein kinase RdoA (MazF antagonist)